MQSKFKSGHVEFEHGDDFKGEVTIKKGDVSVKVTVESLRLFVAESIRYDLAERVQAMKPAELLRRLA